MKPMGSRVSGRPKCKGYAKGKIPFARRSHPLEPAWVRFKLNYRAIELIDFIGRAPKPAFRTVQGHWLCTAVPGASKRS